ncbi:MAG TPA: creatininase family protein [Thermomicrobiales bacterium]|nr:creatininase family protein [Thermomicrobiales bacterium]
MSVMIWNGMTREALGSALPDSVVVLPTAATEQHGPHLATGHDALVLDEIVRRAAGQVDVRTNVVVAPTLAFGSSDHHLPFGGTLSLRSETYLAVVKDLLRSMIESGARRVLVVNGHGGNHELNEIAVRDVALVQPAEQPVVLAAGSWWAITAKALAGREEFGGVRVPGHAGQLETAMMLALQPELVEDGRPAREHDPSLGTRIAGLRVEGEVPWRQFDGFTDSPALATPALGALALDLAAGALAQAITRVADAGTAAA